MEEVEETNDADNTNSACLEMSVDPFMLRRNIHTPTGLRRSGQFEVTQCTIVGLSAADAQNGRRHPMECTINWMPASGMAFAAETASGHLLMMDGAPDGGGRNLAPRPMETVLAGTGACTAYDVVLILKRGRHDVRGCQVKVTSERATTDPKVFTKIHMHFTVTGADLTDTAVERAVRMSHDKYCSASIMLGKTAEITTGFEIVSA
jgi:putative redox protein